MTVKQTMNVNEAISQMDSSQAQNMPTNVVNSQSTVTLLENDMNTDIPEIFSPLGLRAGTRVNCNDFNGPFTDGIHHGSGELSHLINPAFMKDFFQSDCYYIVNSTAANYLKYCVRDHAKNPFCTKNNGACSALQKMPRTYHKMDIFKRVVK